MTYSLPTVETHHILRKQNEKNSYTYVFSDVKKTFLISIALLIAQIILLSLFKNRVLAIANISY